MMGRYGRVWYQEYGRVHTQSPIWTMSPFKGLTWNEAARKATEESKRADELATKMKEHDYSECYCHALKNPPWGGYSVEEQVLHELKQRNKPVDREETQDTRSSRYSYRYANNALTGEIFIHEPFMDELFTTSAAKLEDESVNEPGDNVPDTTTRMLESVSVSNSAKAQAPTERLEELPNEILNIIISNLDTYELGNLSEASRRLTILIGLVPCQDAFMWAVRRCQTYGHTRQSSLCGDCVVAFGKRIDASICQGKRLYRRARG